jgi:hypothetical protein
MITETVLLGILTKCGIAASKQAAASAVAAIAKHELAKKRKKPCHSKKSQK